MRGPLSFAKTARHLLRQAVAQGKDETSAINSVVDQMGDDYRHMITAVFDKHFKIYGSA